MTKKAGFNTVDLLLLMYTLIRSSRLMVHFVEFSDTRVKYIMLYPVPK